ncbi:aspartate/glutamate racemase family protein [Acuticoccus mangrovi]|uniref:Hydantoin racemase n=1 Tax=Acuticoccus mangrovi TaxID=2796142 RepID=A0A934MJ85_9HYPH|nr:aspartate/glutamate racemase family protein [Acuticoccus mangrovi]MBJ3778016.1 hypothetical protein [Acuticoccus mangrovi]
MRLLLLNANTSAGVTELCAAAARTALPQGWDILALTAPFGAKIIESRVENVIGAYALLNMLAEHHAAADAVLIAVSYDTGLAALRDVAPCPVVGMSQASLLTASLLGDRIGLVTFGTPHLYRELAASYGVGERVAGIEVAKARAAEAYGAPHKVREAAHEAITRLVERDGADVVVLCGAAFAGMAEGLASEVAVPILDGVTCGTRLCAMLAGLALPRGSAKAPVTGREGTGLSAALAAMLYGPGR